MRFSLVVIVVLLGTPWAPAMANAPLSELCVAHRDSAVRWAGAHNIKDIALKNHCADATIAVIGSLREQDCYYQELNGGADASVTVPAIALFLGGYKLQADASRRCADFHRLLE